MLRIEQQREAIDQLSIANIISTMRVLSALDWPTFVEAVSRVERILRRDPAGAYADMDRPTRDRYRKSVEQLSRRSGTSELDVAERAIASAEQARVSGPTADRAHHVGYYLISRGRFELERAVGYAPTAGERVARLVFNHPAIGYLGTLLLTTALFETSLLLYARNNGASPWMIALVALVTVLPVSRAGAQLPEHDPHHADSTAAAAEARAAQGRARRAANGRRGARRSCRRPARVKELVDALEVRALANHDENLRFALLGDLPDADAETIAVGSGGDRPGRRAHRRRSTRNTAPSRFYLLNRRRTWNPSEGRWMGWERKRGKLHEFNRVLRGALDTTFDTAGRRRRSAAERRAMSSRSIPIPICRSTPARKLVGTLAHPLNRARFDGESGRVTEGYAVLQPRVAIGAVSAAATTFSLVFSGHVGLDPYTTAVSDVYQDLFGEGSYVGKGIYDVDAFERALNGRVPDNALLSHDLFEGSVCARRALHRSGSRSTTFPATT